MQAVIGRPVFVSAQRCGGAPCSMHMGNFGHPRHTMQAIHTSRTFNSIAKATPEDTESEEVSELVGSKIHSRHVTPLWSGIKLFSCFILFFVV